jgi:hypothetical protein
MTRWSAITGPAAAAPRSPTASTPRPPRNNLQPARTPPAGTLLTVTAKPGIADPSAGLREVRSHLRRVGAALAAGATALLAGLGWVQLHNVFPAPTDDSTLVPLLAFLGTAAALLGIGWLMRTIFAAQRQIPIVSDTEALGTLGSLNERERGIRQAVFKSVAEEQGETCLRAVELKARQAERDAETATTPADKERLKAEAARLVSAVESGVVGAALLILEERSGSVFRGAQAQAAFILTALGIILAFGAADYSKGQRDLVALRKACAEAQAAGVKDPCKSVVTFQSGPRTPADPKKATKPAAIAIGVRPQGSSCAVSARVDGKTTRAAKTGTAILTINDRSRTCGVRLSGGGLALASGWRHTGTTTLEAKLKPLSYTLVLLRAGRGSTASVQEVPLEPLVVAP